MDNIMYGKHSISCTTDWQILVKICFIVIHWSVMIFTFNVVLKSSIKSIHQTILNYIHRYLKIWIYLHVCVTATSFCLQNRDLMCETQVPQGHKVTSVHFKNYHVHWCLPRRILKLFTSKRDISASDWLSTCNKRKL